METSLGGSQREFAATLWTVVLKAKDPRAPDRAEALDRLIRSYWKPVYYFVRQRGHDIETSKDFTQAFFAAFVEKDFLASVDRARGRFKSFLLAALQHFLSKEYDRRDALKRGGGVRTFGFDFADGERTCEPAHEDTPEKAFARNWAATLVARVFDRFRAECREAGHEERAEALAHHLKGASYAEIAAKTGTSVKDVTNFLHRARKRLQELVEDEVRPTVASEEDLREEMGEIFESL